MLDEARASMELHPQVPTRWRAEPTQVHQVSLVTAAHGVSLARRALMARLATLARGPLALLVDLPVRISPVPPMRSSTTTALFRAV